MGHYITVVKTPGGWLVTHIVTKSTVSASGAGAGCSVHSVHVDDAQHSMDPDDFRKGADDA